MAIVSRLFTSSAEEKDRKQAAEGRRQEEDNESVFGSLYNQV